MTILFRILAISAAILPLVAAVPSKADEANRLRERCIDACGAEAPSCTTQCQDLACIDACSVPLSACMNECRQIYPLQNQ